MNKNEIIINFSEHKNVFNIFKVIPNRNTMVILKSIRMVVKKQVLQIIATNLEEVMIYSMPVISKGKHDFLIDAKYLMNIIQNHKKEDIKIYPKEEVIVFMAGDIVYTYVRSLTLNLGSYPVIPDVSKDTGSVAVNYESFCNSVKSALCFTSNEINRPVYRGVYFNHYDQKQYIVATDGKKVYEEELKYSIDKSMEDVLLIKETIILFLRFKKLCSEMYFYRKESRIMIRAGCLMIISYKPDIKFPDHRKVFEFKDKDLYTNLKFKKSLLLGPSNALKSFVSDDTGKIEHRYSKNLLSLTAKRRGESSVECLINIENNNYSRTIYAVNLPYFIICLNAFDNNEEITLRVSKLNDARSSYIPLLFSSGNKRVLLMPLRLG